MDKPCVYFDSECFLCKQLAHFMENSAGNQMSFLPCHEQSEHTCDRLLVRVSGSWLIGEDAWQWIVDNHPGWRRFQWIADKLQLGEGMAQKLETTGSRLRRLCWRCRSR